MSHRIKSAVLLFFFILLPLWADGKETKTPLQTPPQVIERLAEARAYGAKGDGVTDDTAALQKAINSGLPVHVSAGRYIYTTLTLPADLLLSGDGRNRTILETASPGDSIVVAGHRVVLKDLSIRQVGGKRQGKGLVSRDRYWLTTERVDIMGFDYNFYAEKALYHRHIDSRFESGNFGLYYGGAPGRWNVDWYNNVIYCENCRFNSNAVVGLYIKGNNITLVNPDASSCGKGFEILGERSKLAGADIMEPYLEKTVNPFVFKYANIRVRGGYAQGGSQNVPAGSVMDVQDSSHVTVEGLETLDWWKNKYRVKNASVVVADRLWQGAGGAEDTDGSSKIVLSPVVKPQ